MNQESYCKVNINIFDEDAFDEKCRHFGGIIYPSDFNTDYRGKNNINGSTIASRIMSDWNWDAKLSRCYKEKIQYGKSGKHD